LKLLDINRDVIQQNAQIFSVIGPLMDPRRRFKPRDSSVH
jgi:hypothetical protein